MKGKVKQVIFTDKTKKGQPLINKNKDPFYMLHIEVDFPDETIWIGKYYTEDKGDKLKKSIIEGKEYDFDYKVNGQYYNLNSILEGNKNIQL